MALNRTFRLFISSTFSDFMLEREALQTKVFPKLEEYCNSKGAKFLAVDLRWGITEAAQVDHDTLRICLDEIRRSQELSPRPNFAVLLGNRYGWEPIPARIPADIPVDHWDRLLAKANKQNQKIIRSAYHSKPDTNAIPPVYILKSREGDWAANEEAELSIRDALRQAAQSFEGSDRLPYFASATHQEIALGAMQTIDAKDHVHVYVRTIDGLPFTQEGKAFIDWDAKAGALVPGASERLKVLELELRNQLPGMVGDYGTQWLGSQDPNFISDTYLEDFCEQFYQDQKTLIDQELERLGKLEPYEARAKLHEDFAKERSENFVGRKPTLKVIDTYVESIVSNSPKVVTPLILHGEGGTGKSAIMAYAFRNIQTSYPNAAVLARFIGGVPGCEDIGPILRDVIEDICRAYQAPLPKEMNSSKELNEAFESVLNLASEDKPLILFLDAIDQLTNSESAWLLEWLPKELPSHARMILTTRQGPALDNAQRRLPKSLKPVPAMTNADGAKMLDAWLSSYKEARFNAGIAPTIGRKLSSIQRRSVLEQFKNCPKPLWLKLAYEEVRAWRSWDESRVFPNDIKNMVSELINVRLLKDDKHLPIFTHRALAYIAAGRFGLSEDELAKALGSDEAVRKEFQDAEKTDKKWPLDRNQLPPILWSRLYFDLAPYLTNAKIDGAILFRYFHREFKEVIEEELLAGKAGEAIHAKLATIFSRMGDQNTHSLFKQTDISGQQQSPALRRIMEEPWQLAKANQHEKLIELLTNFGYCMAKCAANRSDDLAADYLGAWSTQTCADLSAAAWREIILSQSHLLARGNLSWPAHKILLQLANEHADNSAITLAAQRWLESGVCNWVWVRNRNKPNTFYPSPMLGVMAGHSAQINGVITLPDKRILSWSADCTLRLWDSQTGKQLFIMEGHLDGISGVEVLPQGVLLSWCSSFSKDSDFPWTGQRDDTLRLWNLKTGTPVASLEGHADRLNGAMAISGDRVLSWSADKTLRLWNFEHTVKTKVLTGHTQSVSGARQLSDGRILSWSEDASLRTWNDTSGELESIMIGHKEPVTGVEVLSHGRLLSWSKDSTLRLWDAKTGIEMVVLLGHTKSIVGALVLSDNHLVSWSEDGSLRIWDLNSGNELAVMLGHAKSVRGVQLLSDGRILSWSKDGTARIWDAKTGVCLLVLQGHTDWINGVLDLPGNRFITWADDNTLRLWDGASGEQLQIMMGHKGGALNARLLTDDSIISWSTDGPLRLWDTINGQLMGVLDGHTESVHGVVPLDRSLVVSWSYDNTLRLWDIELSQSISKVVGHTATIGGYRVLEDGRVLSWARDGTIIFWDGKNGKPLVFIEGHRDYVWEASYLPSGQLLSWSGDGTLRIWDGLTGKLVQTFTGHTKDVRGARYLPNGLLMSWSIDGTIRIWDENTGAELLVLRGHTSYVEQVKVLPDGNFLSWSGDGTIRTWNCNDGRQLSFINGKGDADSFSVINVQIINKARIVSTNSDALMKSKDFALKLWDPQTGTLISVLKGHQDEIVDFTVLSDNRILSWSEDCTIRLWDGSTGAPLAEMIGHEGMVRNARMLSDGKVLSLSRDGTVRIWDGANGTLITILLDEKSPINDALLLPDGEVLTCSANGALKSWDLASGKCLKSCGAPWLKDTLIPAEWEVVLPNLKFSRASLVGGVWKFPSRENILFIKPKQGWKTMWNGIDLNSSGYSGSSHFLQMGRNLVFLEFMQGAGPLEMENRYS